MTMYTDDDIRKILEDNRRIIKERETLKSKLEKLKSRIADKDALYNEYDKVYKFCYGCGHPEWASEFRDSDVSADEFIEEKKKLL